MASLDGIEENENDMNLDLDQKISSSSDPDVPGDDSPCNLIVKYLPDTIDEEGLVKLFSPFGNVVKARLIKDKATGRSKGYGFVKFDLEASASKATEQMNGYKIDNKILRVNVANPLASRQAKQANVYVAGLPKSMSKDRVEMLFKTYGPIVEVKILTDSNTAISRGVAFVHFEHYDDATRAITALNGYVPDGSSDALQVRFARLKPSPQNAFGFGQMDMNNGPYRGQVHRYSPYGANQAKGYAQNSSLTSPVYATQSQPTADYYSQFSNPSYNNFAQQPQVSTPTITTPQQSFPTTDNYYNQQAAYSFTTDSNVFPTAYSPYQSNVSSTPSSTDTSLFVFHLPHSATDAQVLSLFATYGSVSRVDIVKDPSTGRNKGYCFVHMPNAQQAANAVSGLNGFNYCGKFLKVSFKTKK